MSLCGALIALAVVAADRLGSAAALCSAPGDDAAGAEQSGTPARLTVPYGVAIAAAGILILLLQSSPPG